MFCMDLEARGRPRFASNLRKCTKKGKAIQNDEIYDLILTKNRFWGVFLIDASTVETAKRDFAEIAKKGGLYVEKVDENYKAGKQLLDNSQNWLLVIDNADDPGLDVAGYFPPGDSGCVLITSRNPECEIYSTPREMEMSYEMADMNLEESSELLLKVAGERKNDPKCLLHARRIAEALGCLPLALVQAGAAIGKTRYKPGIKLEDYLAEFKRNRDSLMKKDIKQGKADYKYSVYTTWVISRNMIEKYGEDFPRESLDALEVLDISSQVYYQDIPCQIFQRTPSRHHLTPTRTIINYIRSSFLLRNILGECEKPAWSYDRIQNAVGLLASYSLVSYNTAKNSFSMHRLVHSWAGFYVKEYGGKTDQRWAQIAASIGLANSIYRSQREAVHYEFRKRLHPHIEFYMSSNDISQIGSSLDAEMACKYAMVFSENGNYIIAEKLMRRSWEWRENRLGSHHHDTLIAANDLAVALERSGRYLEAKEMNDAALQGRRKTMGENHPDTLESLGNLASALQGLGKFEESKMKNESLLATCRSVLGNEAPATLETMNNLASVLQRLGKFDEAVELSKEALALREKTLGEVHPDTLESLSACALNLEYQGTNWGEAEAISRIGLERRKKALGRYHPDTLSSMAHLASFLLKRGNDQEAEKMYTEVYEGRSKVLGAEHPDTVISLSELAEVFRSRKDYETAERMLAMALGNLRKQLGLYHPNILILETNLAVVLRGLGNLEESEKIYKKVLKIYEQNRNQNHPEALKCLMNLATLLRVRKKFDEAERLGRQALEGYGHTVGWNHPDTLKSLQGLAQTLEKVKRYGEAEIYSRKAMEGFENVYDSENPDTLDAVALLAHIEHCCKNYREAEKLYRRACDGYTNLGYDHTAHWCFRFYERFQTETKDIDIQE